MLVVDEDGMPVSPRSPSSSPDSSPDRSQSRGGGGGAKGGKKGGKSKGGKSKYPKGELDDKHLYSVGQTIIRKRN